MGGICLGVYLWSNWSLASPNVALTYVGLPALRAERLRPSHDQSSVPYRHGHSTVSCAAADDRRFVAQRICSDGICHPSVAGGVSGVGVGTQRRVERVFLYANPWSLCALCAQSAIVCSLCNCGVAFCLGAFVKKYACDTAVCIITVGLLAAWPT